MLTAIKISLAEFASDFVHILLIKKRIPVFVSAARILAKKNKDLNQGSCYEHLG
jgi:hypothetical protein